VLEAAAAGAWLDRRLSLFPGKGSVICRGRFLVMAGEFADTP
jgi:hypothetical protein